MKNYKRLFVGTLAALCAALAALCAVLTIVCTKTAASKPVAGTAASLEVRNNGTAIQWKAADG